MRGHPAPVTSDVQAATNSSSLLAEISPTPSNLLEPGEEFLDDLSVKVVGKHFWKRPSGETQSTINSI